MATALQPLEVDERRVRMRRWILLIAAAGILTGATPTTGGETISITVRPAVTGYRGTVRLKVVVERNDKNRSLRWEIDGAEYYRSSQRELDGAGAARIHEFLLRDLPAGEFEVRAIVTRNDRTSAMDRRPLRVVGGPRDP